MTAQLVSNEQSDRLLQDQQMICERCRRPLDSGPSCSHTLSDLAAIDIYAVPLQADH